MTASDKHFCAKKRLIRILRAVIQSAFLGLFIFLSLRTARASTGPIPSNFFIRLDPSVALLSAVNSRNISILSGYYPAWILLFLTLFSGRFFCAWICPLGTCLDTVGTLKPGVLKKKSVKEKAIKTIRGEKKEKRRINFRTKFLLLIILIILSFSGINMLFFSSPLSISNRSVTEVLNLRLPFFLLILLFLSFVLPSRFWCETICPTGALISFFSAAGKRFRKATRLLGVIKEPDLCIKCGKCYTNCDFGVIDPFVNESPGLIVSPECTSCADCLVACPSSGALSLTIFRHEYPRKKSIHRGSRKVGRNAELLKDLEVIETQRLARRGKKEGINTSVEKTTARAEAFSVMNSLVVTRKEFIASGSALLLLSLGYIFGAAVDKPVPPLRMPGAQDERRFLALCARCGECIKVCPAKCLFSTGLEGGFQKIWTPRFIPREASCIFDQCSHACAVSCPTGAIGKMKPSLVRIGTARINRRRCLGFKGESCLVCKERCRFSAIEADGLRPIVISDICTGCGSCENTCPTEPASIRVFPAGEEPAFNHFHQGTKRKRGAI